ncbi:MAG: hypothetical protein WBO46_04845 [Caldilineaceae bacterium]
MHRPLILSLLALLMVLFSPTATAADAALPETDTPTTLAADPNHQIFLPVVRGSFAIPDILPNDAHTLALFPLDGSTQDTSGNNRHATLIGGTFITTTVGQGLQITGTVSGDGQGFQWNAYANLLVHPYSIEMIVTPNRTSSYAKLFSFDDSQDSGWYYQGNGIAVYPNASLGAGKAQPNERHYIAFVSLDNENIEVFLQGVSIGTTANSFTSPPGQAIFFNDDSGTGRGEQLTGVVEYVRISNISRTPTEMQAIRNRLHP